MHAHSMSNTHNYLHPDETLNVAFKLHLSRQICSVVGGDKSESGGEYPLIFTSTF